MTVSGGPWLESIYGRFVLYGEVFVVYFFHILFSDGIRIENSDKYKIHVWDISAYTKTLGVYITGLTRADYGEYKCIGLNDLGKVEDTVYLYGQYALS